MANLFEVVNYDLTVPVTIFSEDGKDVVFHVRSLDNSDAQALNSRRLAEKMSERVGKGKDDKEDFSQNIMVEMVEGRIDPPLDILATCIVSWEWNGHEFGSMGKDPKLTPANAEKVLSLKWIKDLVKPAAQNIENFTGGQKKT